MGQDIRQHRWGGKWPLMTTACLSCHLWPNSGIQMHITTWKFRAVLLNLSVNDIKSFLLLASCPQINYQEEKTAQLKPRMPASSQYSLLRRSRHNSRVSLHSHRLGCFRITPSLSRQQWIRLLTTICLTESTAGHMAKHLIQYFSVLIRNRKQPWRLQERKKEKEKTADVTHHASLGEPESQEKQAMCLCLDLLLFSVCKWLWCGTLSLNDLYKCEIH